VSDLQYLTEDDGERGIKKSCMHEMITR